LSQRPAGRVPICCMASLLWFITVGYRELDHRRLDTTNPSTTTKLLSVLISHDLLVIRTKVKKKLSCCKQNTVSKKFDSEKIRHSWSHLIRNPRNFDSSIAQLQTRSATDLRSAGSMSAFFGSGLNADSKNVGNTPDDRDRVGSEA